MLLYFGSYYDSKFYIVDCFQMNRAGEFSLICHLEILHQMFQLILLLVLQMMAAWAKETARLIFTEGYSIYKRSKWINQKAFVSKSAQARCAGIA
jgi:hypothetical protein